MNNTSLPVEDEQGNLVFIELDSIVRGGGTGGVRPGSIMTYYVQGGKQYWDVHSERAKFQLQEYIFSIIAK